METNSEGIGIIKYYESLRLKAYHCKTTDIDGDGKIDQEKICTIGWGATFYEDGSPIKEEDEITEERAEELLKFHVEIAEKLVKDAVRKPISSNQFSALVSFCYNIKHELFKTSTLVRYLNMGFDKEIVASEFLRWNKSGGVPLLGLVRRREKERQLFLK